MSDLHKKFTGYDIEIQKTFDKFAEYTSTGEENASKKFVQTAIENCDLNFELFANILLELYAIRRFSNVEIDQINPPTKRNQNPLTANKANISIVVTPYLGKQLDLLEKNIIDGMERLNLLYPKIKSKKGNRDMLFALPGGVFDHTVEVDNPDILHEKEKIDMYNLNNLVIQIKYNQN